MRKRKMKKILRFISVILFSLIISAFLTQMGTLRLTHGFDTKGWVKDILIYTPLILALIIGIVETKAKIFSK